MFMVSVDYIQGLIITIQFNIFSRPTSYYDAFDHFQGKGSYLPSATKTHAFRVNNGCSMDTETGWTQVAQ
jgi:hypothetical protein